MRAKSEPRRGAAAVELALVLPFLALMLAGVVDFARVFHATQVLDSAAASAAAYAGGTAMAGEPTRTNPAAARAAACEEGACLSPLLRADQVTVAMTPQVATVTVEYEFPLVTGFLFPGGAVTLRRTVAAPVALRPGD